MHATAESIDGILIVDKPAGPTSHDMVNRTRKLLGIRAVGHAGTLDPMASGVLVVMAGQGTKLAPILTLERKCYRATLRFGQTTDTLDATGRVLSESPLPAGLIEQLRRIQDGLPANGVVGQAIASERMRTGQVPPEYSAIKSNGVRAYQRARAGEKVELASRPVQVSELCVVGADAALGELTCVMNVSKGYYVRSLVRDLGEAVGPGAVMTALRRTSTGPFSVESAIDLSWDPAEIVSRLIPVAQAARLLVPSALITAEGATKARCGKRMSDGDFELAPGEGTTAWIDHDGQLVALGCREDQAPRVLRGFL